MKWIRSALEQYLSAIGRLEPIKLGPEDKRPVDQKVSRSLGRKLDRRTRHNTVLVILCVAMLCAAFAIGAFLVLFHAADPKKISVVFGGSFLGILVITDRLRRLWLQKSILDIALLLVRELSPEEAAKFIETLYWNLIRK